MQWKLCLLKIMLICFFLWKDVNRVLYGERKVQYSIVFYFGEKYVYLVKQCFLEKLSSMLAVVFIGINIFLVCREQMRLYVIVNYVQLWVEKIFKKFYGFFFLQYDIEYYIKFLNFIYQFVRIVVRYYEEKQFREERGEKEEQNRLRRIVVLIAREIEYFWFNIEQVNF